MINAGKKPTQLKSVLKRLIPAYFSGNTQSSLQMPVPDYDNHGLMQM